MISVEDLTFGYALDDEPVLTRLDASFATGSTTALVGRSGSGKSTMLYLIGMMLRPWSGSIRIGNTEVVGLPDWARAEIRARRTGFVFQDALLDPARSILDNVMEGALYDARTSPSQARRQALQLLEDFGVEIDPYRRPGQVSGGQAQRVALARAFVGDPAIVLADEPTGNLDSDTADVVWQALTEQARNGAVVIVATHDTSRAAACDHMIRIGHGAPG